jgi:hypothetical protein
MDRYMVCLWSRLLLTAKQLLELCLRLLEKLPILVSSGRSFLKPLLIPVDFFISRQG